MQHYILVFLIGVFAGAALVGWYCHAFLHARFVELEDAMHARFSSFEAQVAAHLHLHKNPPAPVAPAVPPATQ